MNIYEICLENYYSQTPREFDGEISLQGLQPQSTAQFDYKQFPSIQSHIEQFTFEQLKTRERGCFILEFVGEGLSSRAVIKKGNITLLTRPTVIGHQISLLDENFAPILPKNEEEKIGYPNVFLFKEYTWTDNSEGLMNKVRFTFHIKADSGSSRLLLFTTSTLN